MAIFIVSIAFILLEQKTNLNSPEKLCKVFCGFCGIVMLSKKYNILKCNQYMKSVYEINI